MTDHEPMFQAAWMTLLAENPQLTALMTRVLLKVNGFLLSDDGVLESNPYEQPEPKHIL